MVSDFDYIISINYNNEGIWDKNCSSRGYGIHHQMEGLYLILSLLTQLWNMKMLLMKTFVQA
jgi:hypothetical protein